MEFHEKLQELRKQKGLTQEELAGFLFVSRTAISKWESGRGYPSIESLKAIAVFFDVTVDALLSGDKLLTVAQADTAQKEDRLRDLVFGLLDLSAATLFFLPFFGQRTEGFVQSLPLFALTEIAPYLKAAYGLTTVAMVLTGILTLTLQTCRHPFWTAHKRRISMLPNAAGALLFMVSSQPYAAVLLSVFLGIKVVLLTKKP